VTPADQHAPALPDRLLGRRLQQARLANARLARQHEQRRGLPQIARAGQELRQQRPLALASHQWDEGAGQHRCRTARVRRGER
jgi:hypothetical protein